MIRDNITKINRLNEKIRKCKKCSLSETRTNALCGEGNLNARIMLIAQAPGENEDREGRMFYNSDIRDKIIKNYKKLKIFIQECKWYEVCPMKMFYDKKVLERKWVELYCKGDWESCIRYQLEENGEYHEDWMLPDGTIDLRLKKFL